MGIVGEESGEYEVEGLVGGIYYVMALKFLAEELDDGNYELIIDQEGVFGTWGVWPEPTEVRLNVDAKFEGADINLKLNR